ncbi:oligosaccharide flippase family protein, partial [Flavobacterium sp.]|uniref:oligosaccharide flippase family protein n=1 Tax=Flavobacterium sp. TaxID=239 RepID=UPI0037C08886
MSQLKKGAILSYVTIILTNGIGLVLTPFMIQKLGDSEYGLYTLIGSLIGYISILDFGLNNAIVRFVARYRALEDRKGEENFLATTMLIYTIIASLILAVGVFLYFHLETVFTKLTSSELHKAKVMFGILIFNLTITLPGGAFSAIANAYEHFVFPRMLNIVKYLVRSLLLVAILVWGGDAISIVVLDTVINLLVIGINAFYIFYKLQVKFKLHEVDFTLVREIFNYSFWIFVFAIMGQFQWQSGQVILGVVSGTTAVAIYGVGIMLGTYYGAFSTAISSVFLPRATQMTAFEASGEELTLMMVRIGRFSLITLLMILGGFLLYGQQFILLWVGPTYQSSWLIALIIMFSYTLPLVQSFANSILESKSLFSFKAITYITLIVLGTILGYFLIEKFGAVGLIVGSTSGWILSQVIMNFYYHKVLKLEISRFFAE